MTTRTTSPSGQTTTVWSERSLRVSSRKTWPDRPIVGRLVSMFSVFLPARGAGRVELLDPRRPCSGGPSPAPSTAIDHRVAAALVPRRAGEAELVDAVGHVGSRAPSSEQFRPESTSSARVASAPGEACREHPTRRSSPGTPLRRAPVGDARTVGGNDGADAPHAARTAARTTTSEHGRADARRPGLTRASGRGCRRMPRHVEVVLEHARRGNEIGVARDRPGEPVDVGRLERPRSGRACGRGTCRTRSASAARPSSDGGSGRPEVALPAAAERPVRLRGAERLAPQAIRRRRRAAARGGAVGPVVVLRGRNVAVVSTRPVTGRVGGGSGGQVPRPLPAPSPSPRAAEPAARSSA